MMKETIIEDSELGCLIVRVNPRARSLVFRTKREAVYVSVPLGTTLKEVKQAIETMTGLNVTKVNIRVAGVRMADAN